MTKINEGPGGTKQPKEFNLEEEILKGVFKDDADNVRGETIGIESLRKVDQQYDTGGRDVFDAPKADIGADLKPEPEVDVKKLRRESDQGLTVQMNKILMQRNLKNSGKI
ncbi:MAG TPA: hypothetical protein VLH08_21120 [Acidobacteriota bacterium]|nr:hypothetical protein [Acidobacteriota bacterium]